MSTNFLILTPLKRQSIWSHIPSHISEINTLFESPYDKTIKMACAPREDSDQTGHPVWSESSITAWRELGSFASPERTSKTLIRLGGCLVWSWGGSFNIFLSPIKLFSLNCHLLFEFLHRCTKIPHNTRNRMLENAKIDIIATFSSTTEYVTTYYRKFIKKFVYLPK